MISCGLCEQFKSGVCPIGTPWRRMESCIFKVDTPEIREEKDTNMDKNVRNKKMFEEYKAGATVGELVERYGLSNSFVKKILSREGKPRTRARLSKMDVDTKTAILLSLSEGESINSLARDYGISEYLIRKLKKEGLVDKPIESEKEELTPSVEIEKQDSISVDIEPEVLFETVMEPKPALTFYVAGDLLKPFKNCYPTEFEKRLTWAIDLHSLEDLSTLIDEADGSLVIDGQFIDVIPVSIRDRK